MHSKKDYLVGLDAIRFIAAVSVAYFHLAFATWAGSEPAAGSLFKSLATFPELVSSGWFGWVGVEVFFVVSGLVIGASAASASGPSEFLRHRALRLYPAVWICAPVSILIVAAYRLDFQWHRQAPARISHPVPAGSMGRGCLLVAVGRDHLLPVRCRSPCDSRAAWPSTVRACAWPVEQPLPIVFGSRSPLRPTCRIAAS